MKLRVRGYQIQVQAKVGTQATYVLRSLESRSNEELARMEAESYPERHDIRLALGYLEDAEQVLREVMLDKMDEAEERLSEATFQVWDDYTEDENGNSVGILYPENVDAELDAVVHELYEVGMNIRRYLDE